MPLMCQRAMLAAVLASLLADSDSSEAQDAEGDPIMRPKGGWRLAKGMNAAQRKKARDTLLGEYWPGTQRVLPEHRPIGPPGMVRESRPSLLGGGFWTD